VATIKYPFEMIGESVFFNKKDTLKLKEVLQSDSVKEDDIQYLINKYPKDVFLMETLADYLVNKDDFSDAIVLYKYLTTELKEYLNLYELIETQLKLIKLLLIVGDEKEIESLFKEVEENIKGLNKEVSTSYTTLRLLYMFNKGDTKDIKRLLHNLEKTDPDMFKHILITIFETQIAPNPQIPKKEKILFYKKITKGEIDGLSKS